MMHPLHTYKISTLIFVITFLGCSANAIAQPKDSSFKKFGFQIGVSLSNMNFNEGVPPPPEHANASWQPGFTFIFQLRVPLAKKWVLQPEYAYSRRNGSDQTIPTTFHIDYLSFPVLINYQLSPRFNILAGPQFEITLKASSSTNGNTANITHEVEERGFGAMGGVEFLVLKSFVISGRYFQGLNHIGIDQGSTTKEFKYQSFLLTAGVRF